MDAIGPRYHRPTRRSDATTMTDSTAEAANREAIAGVAAANREAIAGVAADTHANREAIAGIAADTHANTVAIAGVAADTRANRVAIAGVAADTRANTATFGSWYHGLNARVNILSRHTDLLTDTVDTLSRVVEAIPRVIVSGTLDLTNTVASKLRAIGDAFRGDKDEGNDTNFVQIKQKHYDFLENTRKNNKTLYRKLHQLVEHYQSMPPEQQDKLLLLFFDPKPLKTNTVGSHI